MDVFMLKNGTTSTPNTREQPYVCESYSFSTKLSDLDRRNRKLSAHDCNDDDHIKNLFSSHNYHETRNINTSHAAMCLVPGHNCATLLAKVHRTT